MEKRVLQAVFLSFLVLYAYQALFPPPKPQAGSPQAAGAERGRRAPAAAGSADAATATPPAADARRPSPRRLPPTQPAGR